MKKWTRLMMLAMLPAVMLVSCDEDDDDVIVQEEARIMVVHASPDAPGVDLLIDDEKVNTSALTYPDNTGYLTVDAGSRNIKVNLAGSNTTVIQGNLNAVRDQSYSVFAYGTAAEDDDTDLSALVITDDLTAPASGNAKVRFIHLSPDAPTVDIVNVTDEASEAVLFDAQRYGVPSAFQPVLAGSYDLEVRLEDGTVVPLDGLEGIQLQNGSIYTIIATGFVTTPEGNTNALSVEIIEHETE
ncbi:DUF4397 domain-containing protein [Pontibacter sp. KCTC 32443]|uniref:DUF4397 domain-containing protein n=1 Tax=Pontibacter TaxID=323449 RepID=UPI00164E484D|nr:MULTISPECIES: DUF4397 domain-containing protein [Pontibacter]MBC5774123.1 DUF4397 domain-containing protein [Pontibacter sp. KCTC 32443]